MSDGQEGLLIEVVSGKGVLAKGGSRVRLPHYVEEGEKPIFMHCLDWIGSSVGV